TKSFNRDWLIKRIGWRLQANAEGDLSERARRRAAELANDADLRVKAPKEPAARTVTRTVALPTANGTPRPGTIITREYKNRTIQVAVKANGFEFEGEQFKTLSALAKKITGTH